MTTIDWNLYFQAKYDFLLDTGKEHNCIINTFKEELYSHKSFYLKIKGEEWAKKYLQILHALDNFINMKAQKTSRRKNAMKTSELLRMEVEKRLKGVVVLSFPINKDGETRDVIQIVPVNEISVNQDGMKKPDITNGTTIDISDLLSIVHQGGVSISNVAAQISYMYNTTQIVDRDYILDNVVLSVSNCKSHQTSYKGLNVLSWPWLDLVFTYSVIIEDEDNESSDETSVLVVGEELIQETGLTSEEIHKAALKNTIEMTCIEYLNNESLKEGLLFRQGGNYTHEERIDQGHELDDAVIVAVSSWDDVVGAATLLNTGVFQKIAEAMDSDLYVVPYTTTEVLVFRTSPQEHIKKVIKLINEETIPEALFLSKNLYLFEKDTSHFILV